MTSAQAQGLAVMLCGLYMRVAIDDFPEMEWDAEHALVILFVGFMVVALGGREK